MPLDTITLTAIRAELEERIEGMRIDKVQQPERDMLVLTIRGRHGDMKRLLISVNTSNTRVHLTEHRFENPQSPPMFCMLLRKHLTGAKICDITQPPSERILEFTLKTSTAMGDAAQKRLVLELFGRVPNIILIDDEGRIIDCLRRISGDMHGRRMVLPGLKYHPPDPLPAGNTGLKNCVAPHSIANGSISEALDKAHTRKAKEESMRRHAGDLIRTMKTAQKRVARRLDAQKTELEETAERDYLRECGDIIIANLHRIKKGDEFLIADDFYADSGLMREIKLDALRSPQKNAEKYYKAYTKARNAAVHLKEQIENGEKEFSYIASVLEQLARAEGVHELEEIRSELVLTKYLKEKKTRKQKRIESKPLQFTSSSGMQILVGKNNTQNDLLTFKTAAKSDIWLHTQKIHGAHVIIRTDGMDVDDATLTEAAAFAVYYSAARGTGKTSVDYTLAKNVKKPSGARPGEVIYTGFKTMMAGANEGLMLRLKGLIQ